MMTTAAPLKQYVEFRDSGYWIENSRMSLDSIIYTYLDGNSPESIAKDFPLISLEAIYGAIAFYLANRAAIDEYLELGQADFKTFQQDCRAKSPVLYAKLKAAQEMKQG